MESPRVKVQSDCMESSCFEMYSAFDSPACDFAGPIRGGSLRPGCQCYAETNGNKLDLQRRG